MFKQVLHFLKFLKNVNHFHVILLLKIGTDDTNQHSSYIRNKFKNGVKSAILSTAELLPVPHVFFTLTLSLLTQGTTN